MTTDVDARRHGDPVRGGQARGGRVERWRWAGAAAAALAVATSLTVPAGRHQWALSFVRQPSRTTALAFADPTALPGTWVRGRPLDVRFTISNDEGRPMTYPYRLTQWDGARSGALAAGEVTVADGVTSTLTRTIRPTCRRSPCRIEVSLPGHPQSIHVLVRSAPSGGGDHA